MTKCRFSPLLKHGANVNEEKKSVNNLPPITIDSLSSSWTMCKSEIIECHMWKRKYHFISREGGRNICIFYTKRTGERKDVSKIQLSLKAE